MHGVLPDFWPLAPYLLIPRVCTESKNNFMHGKQVQRRTASCALCLYGRVSCNLQQTAPMNKCKILSSTELGLHACRLSGATREWVWVNEIKLRTHIMLLMSSSMHLSMFAQRARSAIKWSMAVKWVCLWPDIRPFVSICRAIIVTDGGYSFWNGNCGGKGPNFGLMPSVCNSVRKTSKEI